MKTSIMVLGSVNRDLVVHAPRLPCPGETLRGQRFGSGLGGKGANQAVAAARLGAQVRLVARVGAQESGGALLTQLSAEGVETALCLQPASETPGVALIVVSAQDGENQIVTVAGSNAGFTPQELGCLPLHGVDWLVMQQELPVATLRAALEQARSAGVSTLLNAAPYRAEAKCLLPLVDMLVVNQGEALALLGQTAPNGIGAAAWMPLAQSLRALGPRAVLLSLGAEGALWVDAERSLCQAACRVQAVDTVGAGDTLVGALVTALGEGQTVEAALAFATAAAAWAVARPGVQAAMPHRAELDAWMAGGA